jgi:DMSO/TMAO reductase YedYZ molybdopterin-dependent catalytic subunit
VGPNGYDGLLTKGQDLPPITPNDRFYVVTKNVIDPNIARGLWRLQVTGLVERPHTYDFDELTSLAAVDQIQTLECISNRVGGRLMSNAAWRGVRLPTLLTAAGPGAGVRTVALHASDGYTHALAFDKAMEPTTLVAYEMNGEPLPQRHGYPARVLVPGGYGELSVKWVDRIELLDESFEGYYERQGWRPGVVRTTARFDTPFGGERLSLARTPTVPLAGVAFSGDRGISKVEFSTDRGSTWQEASIGYAPSPMAWAMWSGSWTPPGPGSYTLSVRATDGAGALQSSRRMGSAPSGASGYQRIPVTVEP